MRILNPPTGKQLRTTTGAAVPDEALPGVSSRAVRALLVVRCCAVLPTLASQLGPFPLCTPPRRAAKKEAASSKAQQPAATGRQQQQQQRDGAAGATATSSLPPSASIYSRAGYVGHGDAIGLAARRRARGSAAQDFQLPQGWRQQPVPPGSKASPSGRAGPAGKKQRQQEPQQQYVSPEGLVFPSLQAVQEVVEGPVVVPRRLIRWAKRAAADPLSALDAPSTTSGLAHLLGLRRVRAMLVPADRRQMQRRVAAAAAEKAAAVRSRRRS